MWKQQKSIHHRKTFRSYELIAGQKASLVCICVTVTVCRTVLSNFLWKTCSRLAGELGNSSSLFLTHQSFLHWKTHQQGPGLWRQITVWPKYGLNLLSKVQREMVCCGFCWILAFIFWIPQWKVVQIKKKIMGNYWWSSSEKIVRRERISVSRIPFISPSAEIKCTSRMCMCMFVFAQLIQWEWRLCILSMDF